MLGENDLIFLGACFFLTKEANNPSSKTDREIAVNNARKLYKLVFAEDNTNDKMILE